MTVQNGYKNKEFVVRKLNEIGIQKAFIIRDGFDTLLNILVDVCKDGGNRELAICKTKLEEACSFAKKSMAINEINQIIGQND